jgi:iron complex outermembrane receptor protein
MASAWFQYSDRRIPPTMTESESRAELMDRSWRTMLVWKDFNAASTLEAKVAYFNEFERYVDPNTDVYSVIHSQAATGAFETTWNLFPTSTFFGGVNYTFEYADLDFYDGPEDQQSLSLYVSWMQEIPCIQWKISANVRQEFMTGFRVPFLYSIGATGNIWQFVSGRLSFSRNFRAPTLNERFWVPGGNPELEPEDSYNLEAGITLAPKLGRLETSLSVTGFSSWVNNWILWLPGAGFWSVENAQEVWSRGLELILNEGFRAGQVRLDLAGSYTLTFSTNEKKLSEYDASYKQQLIYTPEQRFMLKAGAGWKGFRVTLRGNYTGTVYTTRDNEAFLPPYFLVDGIVAKDFRIGKRLPLTVQLNLNNLTGKDYETVPYRPMPGFNFMATVVVGVRSRESGVGSHYKTLSSTP